MHRPAGREALVVVRTPTTLDRLLDVLPALGRDPRVALSWAVDEGSRFTLGLRGRLDGLGVRPIPWAEVRGRRFDLVAAAHVNPSLGALRGPLVVVPHGIGFNRLVPSRTGDATSPVGLSRGELTDGGAVVPTWIGLSHPRQLAQLRASCPEACDRAFPMGDPTWDRITAERGRRDRFRAAFGVRPDQALVVVSSTWNAMSAFEQRPDLVGRLVAQLPADAFRVALVLHPNVWAERGPRRVRALLRGRGRGRPGGGPGERLAERDHRRGRGRGRPRLGLGSTSRRWARRS